MEGSLSLRDDFVLSNLLPLSSFCGFIHVGFRIITLFVSDGTLLPTRPQPRFFQNRPPSLVPSPTKASKSVSAKTFAFANVPLQPLPRPLMAVYRTMARPANSIKSSPRTIHMRNNHTLPCPHLVTLLQDPPSLNAHAMAH
jgi:hypothetical protein